jgi:penicillin amidase
MKAIKYILLSILTLLIIIILSGIFYLRNLSHRAIPDYNKDIQLQGLHFPVEVYRDSYAIPHVYAQDEHDLYMVVGYLLAQDRLWQMDLLRHVTEGRLSEILGKSQIENDLILRALRFREKSERILEQEDPVILNALESFVSGINQFIKKNKNRLPPEFAILKYKPGKWELYQTVNMIGYMGWDLKTGWNEILLANIQKKVDSLRYKQLLPDLLRDQPVIYPSNNQETSTSTLIPDILTHLASLEQFGAEVFDASNNWAVSGSKSATSQPLLANDMHLDLSVPGIWYQMHEVVEGKLDVTGVVLPCTPLVICGHNDSIAWGMTNTFVDNVDFYEEKVNPDDSTQYACNGSWCNFKVQKEIIKLNNGEQIERTLRFSHRGPVVSSFKKMTDKVITMHWVGDEMSDEIKTVFLINRANNWNDFTYALKTFTSISQNIVYADRKGNIGLFCAAGIPIRKRDLPFGVLPGQTDEYDWKGYVPFEELPYQYNPVCGYVASANNRTVSSSYPYHIGMWYDLPARYDRITELLSSNRLLSIEDFMTIQLDQKSKMAEKYLPSVLEILKSDTGMNAMENEAFEILKKWDYNMASSSAAAAIFETWYFQFIQCTFSDELGSELFNSFMAATNVSHIATDQLIDDKISSWFDNITTTEKTEDFRQMILCAYGKAVSYLSFKMGNNPDNWEWGRIHQLVLAHPMSVVKILDRVLSLNRGPYAVGGSFHTVSPFTNKNGQLSDISRGASQRHLFDLSNWDNSLTVIPTGISGIPASRHYCDQTKLYINGQYHPDFFLKEKVIANAKYKMKFLAVH